MAQKTFDIASLSDNLLDLISSIQNHVEVTLTCEGIPCATVLPLSPANLTVTKEMSCEDVLEPRVPGFWQGQVKISDDFDDTSEEVITAFYGEE
jgi:antitoxin (DNA-binding transcriptional repressor) of toxin-antitoxin stability system